MGYRPQGSQQGGYGQQPELRPGVPVTSADGQWKGTVVEVLPAGRGYEGTVRVQWDGYGLTYVTLSMLGYDNGRFVVRADSGQANQGGQQAGQAQQGANVTSATDAAVANNRFATGQTANTADDATRMANASRAEQRNEANPTYPALTSRDDEMTRYAPPTPAPAPTYPVLSEQGGADEIARQSQPAYSPVQDPARPTNPYQAEAAYRPAVQSPATAAPAEIIVPEIEERLTAQPQWRDAGNVTVRTSTEEVPQSFTQQVEREEAFVERVPVGRVLADDENPVPRQEGDTYIMPVIVEEAVVVTRRLLAEEVRITKRIVQSTQTVEATVRRQRAEIDAGTLGDRVHDGRQGF